LGKTHRKGLSDKFWEGREKKEKKEGNTKRGLEVRLSPSRGRPGDHICTAGGKVEVAGSDLRGGASKT